MTPITEDKINKMHRGKSCISVVEELPKKEQSKKELAKVNSSSLDKQIDKDKNKRKIKKKINIKQSSLAEHFSKKPKVCKNKLDEISDPIVIGTNKYTNSEAQKSDSRLEDQHKIDSQKVSIQACSISYFRLGKNVEKNYFRQKNSKVAMPSIVKGADHYIKSRSKQVRPSVKLAEIQPFGLNGVSIIKNSKLNTSKIIENTLLDYSRGEATDQNGFMFIQSFKSNQAQ
jgi:hypothetical protein